MGIHFRACPCGSGYPLQVLTTLWAFHCYPSRNLFSPRFKPWAKEILILKQTEKAVYCE